MRDQIGRTFDETKQKNVRTRKTKWMHYKQQQQKKKKEKAIASGVWR